MKPIVLGVLSSFFFAFTFVLNRMMSVHGGSWLWSASLRYLFMLPFLLAIVAMRGNLWSLFAQMRERPWAWLLWSTVGFGLFYGPLCMAALYSPAWLVAATWQCTIVAGSLLVPLFHEHLETRTGVVKVRKRIPLKGLAVSSIILVGIVLVEVQRAGEVPWRDLLLGGVPVLVAAFAYPLGNRKMMELCSGRVDTVQRVLGMTLASLPLWLILGLYALFRVGPSGIGQTTQSLVVAVFSGVIATILFFYATDLTKGNVHQLAAVEATQSGEVVFALMGELLLLPGTAVSGVALAGIGIIIIGIVLHSFSSVRPTKHESTSVTSQG
jgi:drug/metabolite transporter (DMT)-like permease